MRENPSPESSPRAPHTATWTPELSVGVDEIDEQHRELLDRIDRLLRTIEDHHADDEIRRLLGFLETHVVLHFGTEEKLMVRTGYAGTRAHRDAHQRFLEDFSAIQAQFEAAGATPAMVQAVSSRVCGWLCDHIRSVDRGLGRFLKSRAVDAPPPESAPPADPPSALIWTEDLSVGVELIDQQHQELFRRVNKLLAASRRGLARHEVGPMLDFLGQYVIEHFEAEEAAMRASVYPDYSTHKAQHDGLKRELAHFSERLTSAGANVALVVELNRTVCAWLTNHVRRSDKALGRYLTCRAGRASSS